MQIKRPCVEPMRQLTQASFAPLDSLRMALLAFLRIHSSYPSRRRGYDQMKRPHPSVLMIAAGAVVAIIGAVQAGAQTPGWPGGRAPAGAGAKSLRPADSRRIRTAVTSLLGWRVGLPGNVFRQLTFSETAGMADALGLASIEGFSTQKVSPVIPKNLDYSLSPDEVAAVKNRLLELRLRMPAYHAGAIDADENSRRKLFEFAKSLDVETIVSVADPASLPTLDKLANEFGINVAIETSRDAKSVMAALEGRSQRIGVSVDTGDWIEQGIKPAEGLSLLKDRLMVVDLRDRNASGAGGRDVTLGSGVAGLAGFFLDLARQAPEPQESPAKCVNCSRPYGGVKPLFLALDARSFDAVDQFGAGSGTTFAELWRNAEGFEKAVRPAMGYRVDQDSRLLPITSTDRVTADARQKIEAALPRKALATPKKPRKLLVIDLCPAGGYYHDTIAHANLALELMAKYTGAYQPVFSNDLDNLRYPKIRQYDAVFLNSVVGEVFPDPEVLDGLLRFVREGGGVAGIHGATYASMDLPEFAEMMGAADGPHRVETATLKIDDPNSPLTRGFDGKGFTREDEFYHFLPSGPFSRDQLHVLISIDTAKSDMSTWKVRPDNDYGLVWIKSYGRGRVFNCAMGHTPTLLATPAMAELMLGAIQFVLGDLEADTTPSARLAARK